MREHRGIAGERICAAEGPRLEFFIRRAATGKTEHHIAFIHDLETEITVAELHPGDTVFTPTKPSDS